jgi:hypothetical protein
MLAQNLEEIQSGAGITAPDNIGPLISNVIPYIFGIAGFLLLIYLVLGGFQLMTSQGEPKAIAGAQAKITNALIGFVVILISAGVVVILGRLLKVDVFSNIF